MKQTWHKIWDNYSREISDFSVFIAAFVVCFVIFYLRFPNNFQFPNFFAEDGATFSKNLIDHGLIHSLDSTFNGYYIWGLYLLNKLALILNSMIYGGAFETIPKAIALVSYTFLALCASAPMLVFRRRLGTLHLTSMTLLLAFVPLQGSDYAIIGTLGNLKFVFVYLAFLLLIIRLRQPRTSQWMPLIDLGLVLCAYTAITTYLLLPVFLLQDGLRPRDWWTRDWKKYLKDNWAFWSTLGLGLVLLWQVFVMVTHGVPKLPGYLDTPFNTHRAVEVLVARPYLYGVSYWFYGSLRDWSVLGLLIFITIVSTVKLSSRWRTTYWLAFYTVAITTILFVLNRPGISSYFLGYQGGPVDQFFYTQNLIFDVAIMLLVATGISRIKQTSLRIGANLVVLGAILGPAAVAGSYGSHDFMQKTVGPIHPNVVKACSQDGNTVLVHIYPVEAFQMKESRRTVCGVR